MSVHPASNPEDETFPEEWVDEESDEDEDDAGAGVPVRPASPSGEGGAAAEPELVAAWYY